MHPLALVGQAAFPPSPSTLELLPSFPSPERVPSIGLAPSFTSRLSFSSILSFHWDSSSTKSEMHRHELCIPKKKTRSNPRSLNMVLLPSLGFLPKGKTKVAGTE